MNILAPKIINDFLKHRLPIIISQIPEISFRVIEEDPRNIVFSQNFSSITLSACDIADMGNDYNKVGLLQVFYRFVGFHSLRNGIFLLHGSALSYGNKTILFGDNGTSIGKTLSSLELGLISKQYVADEFIFWDSNSGQIISDDNIPIHVRDDVRTHLQKSHNIKITNNFVPRQLLGFEFCNHKQLDFICYVNFVKGKEKIVRLSEQRALNYAKITFTAHIKKMFYPELDRFKFITKQDNVALNNNYSVSNTSVFNI